MKKPLIFSALLIYLAGLYYLTRPMPSLPVLSDSVRSDEPGDTVQHPDQAAYYTLRDSRPEILSELQKKFNLKNSWTGVISYRLNYRPEEVGVLVRDQLRSYYLEEVVHPLRESVFVNVFDPEKSPMIDDEKRAQARMYFKDVFYPRKVTLRPVYSRPPGRILVWTLIFPATYLVLHSLKQSLKSQI